MRLWLTFIAGPNSLADLQEMVEPIRELFAGLVVTYHGERDDLEAKYLEIVKGEGRVIYQPYCGRHDHSRNTALWCGPIEQGDWCVQTDVLEHPNRVFIEKHVPYLISQSNAIFYYYGKPFLFQFHESMRYEGTPHESLRRFDGQGRGHELNQMWPNEADVRLNVRPLKRPSDHWVNHFARYMLLPWGSNHALLGLDINGDVNRLFPIRESKRLAFRDEMRRRGYPVTLDGLKAMLSKPLDDKLRDMVNSDKVWCDWYQYYILGNKSVVCGHDDRDMIPVLSPRSSTVTLPLPDSIPIPLDAPGQAV